ncbi:MAG TPA: hypothetical protein VIJ71_06735 [Mycobacteriales bacterium]
MASIVAGLADHVRHDDRGSPPPRAGLALTDVRGDNLKDRVTVNDGLGRTRTTSVVEVSPALPG